MWRLALATWLVSSHCSLPKPTPMAWYVGSCGYSLPARYLLLIVSSCARTCAGRLGTCEEDEVTRNVL